MDEIGKIYFAQKKKELCHRFKLFGMTVGFISILTVISNNLDQLKKYYQQVKK